MIRVFPDGRRLARAAARYIVRIGRRSVAERGKFELVLSGGRTPSKTYRALAEAAHNDRHLWNHTHVFWGDERWVPADHQASNYRMARTYLLDFVKIPSDQIHPIPTHLSDPREAAALYEKIFPLKPDLLLLGIGEDGHTASLFPGSSALAEAERRIFAVEAPAEPKLRITLTPPMIAAAREVLVLVSGSSKAEAVRRVFVEEGSIDETPAKLLREATWYVDEAAARQIAPLSAADVVREDDRGKASDEHGVHH